MRIRAGPVRIGVMGSEPLSRARDVLQGAVHVIHSLLSRAPDVGLILGSGLGPLADDIVDATVIPYGEVPGMPVSTAPGHAGRFVAGTLAGRTVIVMQGRVHPYEGYSAARCAFPVRIMHALGARSLLVTNACGGLDPKFHAGEYLLHEDMINATGQNPLTGPNDGELGPRFPVMFDCYDAAYRHAARAAARVQDVVLREGIYLAFAGPSYATRAELRAFRLLGADAVGMSTVHEVIAARHLGMRVVGLSIITDMALPDRLEHATGDQVIHAAEEGGAGFRRLVTALLPEL